MSLRPVKEIIQTKPTIEGAGVRLQRAFGFGKTKEFDPFLLLDDFRNENPEDYLAGFPWHPHRGIETITYVLAGSVEHGDSLGNKGKMTAGDVQWMTAGSGILHQEMPKGDARGRTFLRAPFRKLRTMTALRCALSVESSGAKEVQWKA
jgi:redox-sensitive bicupin YhaK (pirin superfamily)